MSQKRKTNRKQSQVFSHPYGGADKVKTTLFTPCVSGGKVFRLSEETGVSSIRGAVRGNGKGFNFY